MKCEEQLKAYQPFNEQEKQDKQMVVEACKALKEVLTRKSKFAHFTASAWALNPKKDKILMVYHNLFQTWVEPGGHADGEEDLQQVALKELQEETGVKQVKSLQEGVFSLQVVAIKGHKKNGEYISSHLHLDATFLFEVEETEKLKMCEGENTGVKWIPLQNLEQYCQDSWYSERIYSKLKEKLKSF